MGPAAFRVQAPITRQPVLAFSGAKVLMLNCTKFSCENSDDGRYSEFFLSIA
jgi:hypothetical protein